MFRRKHMPRLVNILAWQVGFLLPMAVMATLLGALAVLSVAALVAAQFRAQAEAEDNTQAYYVADAAIMAVASDLIRGANIAPLPPNDYVPPTVNISGAVPLIAIQTIEPAVSSTTKPITYLADDAPAVSIGINAVGGAAELADDDGKYYQLSASGTPQTLSYEVESSFGLKAVDFAEVSLKLRSWEETALVEVFVYNPANGGGGYSMDSPAVSQLVDHRHIWHQEADKDQGYAPHEHGGDGRNHHIDAKDTPDHAHHGHEDHRHSVPGSPQEDVHRGGHGLSLDEDSDLDHKGAVSGEDAANHGDEAISFFLSEAALNYLNQTDISTLKIKVVATVFDDPDHHHHESSNSRHNQCADSKGKVKKGKDCQVHDHIHHGDLIDPPPLRLETGLVRFTMVGPATAEKQPVAGEPGINVGSLVAGTGADLNNDDLSFYTVESQTVATVDPGDPQSYREALEFEVVSQPFLFHRFDSVSVPFVFQSTKQKKVKVKMYVYNTNVHGPSGYGNVPDLVKTIDVAEIGRSVGLSIPRKDIAFLNAQAGAASQITIRLKIRATLDKPFALASGAIRFIAVTTDDPRNAVREASLQYIDPSGGDPAFAELGPGEGFLTRLYSLQPGIMNVN